MIVLIILLLLPKWTVCVGLFKIGDDRSQGDNDFDLHTNNNFF